MLKILACRQTWTQQQIYLCFSWDKWYENIFWKNFDKCTLKFFVENAIVLHLIPNSQNNINNSEFNFFFIQVFIFLSMEGLKRKLNCQLLLLVFWRSFDLNDGYLNWCMWSSDKNAYLNPWLTTQTEFCMLEIAFKYRKVHWRKKNYFKTYSKSI